MSMLGLLFLDVVWSEPALSAAGLCTGPPEPNDPPVSVASSATCGSSDVLRFFSSFSAKMISERLTTACTSLSSAALTRFWPSSVSLSSCPILSRQVALCGRQRGPFISTSLQPGQPGVRP